uniref:Secreted protein n=1 Tax=Prorocentrum micans TaxID=2945 RepID=A0A7S2TC13_PROMC
MQMRQVSLVCRLVRLCVGTCQARTQRRSGGEWVAFELKGAIRGLEKKKRKKNTLSCRYVAKGEFRSHFGSSPLSLAVGRGSHDHRFSHMQHSKLTGNKVANVARLLACK